MWRAPYLWHFEVRVVSQSKASLDGADFGKWTSPSSLGFRVKGFKDHCPLKWRAVWGSMLVWERVAS